MSNKIPSATAPFEGTSMIVNYSTSESSKKFKITVNDSGAISATEIT